MGRNHKNKKKMEWVGIAKKDGVGRNCKKKHEKDGMGRNCEIMRKRCSGSELQKNMKKWVVVVDH